MSTADLYWLPELPDWVERAKALGQIREPADLWCELRNLANSRIDFVRTNRIDAWLERRFSTEPPSASSQKPVRLGILGSSTLTHLISGIRVAALRRDIWMSAYEAPYGQYHQELLDPNSGLYAFKPSIILFAFDARHLLVREGTSVAADDAGHFLEEVVGGIRDCWCLARERFGCVVLQQTVLNVFYPLIGGNEHRLPNSPYDLVHRLNAAIREIADANGVDVVSADLQAARHGLATWSDPVLWHRAKQEISPACAPIYGEWVARIVAAKQGRSAKCLVLDLDNTLWGGVIGDDGVENIALGQGNIEGEVFVDFQRYVKRLSERGVILAICSKNEEANALAPFKTHPEMVLRLHDIACFVANWNDKASNIRRIAHELNIGLDALVFADDNPFERNLVRQELPMISVPEMPSDPAYYAQTIADAGYFEGLGVTEEDRARTKQYQENRARDAFKAEARDIVGYLRSLNMRLHWMRFKDGGLQRVVQLINKTNQFNLTSRRYTEQEIAAIAADDRAFGLQFRLMDRFGDNGVIAVVIGKTSAPGKAFIDTWLMSCRVLGRQVEEETLNIVVEECRRRGISKLIGQYISTEKNGMVKTHYSKLGFTEISGDSDIGVHFELDLARFIAHVTPIKVEGPQQ